jgi:regulator of protease activity HflC (stomatin/prohibitin superfamily)
MAGLQNWLKVEREIRARRSGQATARPSAPRETQGPSSDGSIATKGERIMLFVQKFIVRKHERGLLYKDGDFLQFLAPGTYRYFDARGRYTVERFDITKPAFEHRLTDYLLEADRAEVDRLFEVVETRSDEVALVYFNERVAAVLGPAERKLYWKGVVAIRVERFDLAQSFKLDARVAKRLVTGTDARVLSIADQAVYARVVPEGHVGLLYVDGELTDTLRSGLHAFWRYERGVNVELVDLRVKTLEVQGQEILTKDKVALRINLAATYRFVDAAKAVRAVKDPLDHLYKEIQFGLRAAVGTRTLDALLEDKTAIDREVAAHLGQRFTEIGLSVESVGVKDIILPGEMKELLGKVVEAEKAAQANVIRRREETNATRSLLNTAKVMESNAVALRLKELETLEKVTEKVGTLSVYGGLDAVLNELVRLKQ